ncbi:hypothetical protein G7046_g6333 [Stylonectria norvegica]|nr:hypothetical protein G7046_g6333 [Stylonectria norvegica]
MLAQKAIEFRRDGVLTIAIIGAGTIGLSFAALHLSAASNQPTRVFIYDPRTDLKEYIESNLLDYLSLQGKTAKKDEASGQNATVTTLFATGELIIASTLQEAVQQADIVQEQGPENAAFKQQLWSEVESLSPQNTLFWSSTSGIPASVQSEKMQDKSRLIILHPFNPPHIMPLLELISTSEADAGSSDQLARTKDYWRKLNRDPIPLKREITGFVANRLSFALFREAAYLVERGVVSVADLDKVVEQSIGPRWAVKGPFWSYHAGGGQERGLEGFLDKIGDTIQSCWDDLGNLNLRCKSSDEGMISWQDSLCRQVEGAYGKIGSDQLKTRDEMLQAILDITKP